MTDNDPAAMNKDVTGCSNIPDRVPWIDTLKFLGILAIYIGHFGNLAGYAYQFVFTYHVPLFFFVSGFFALKHKEETLLQTINRKAVSLLIPYALFCALSILMIAIQKNMSAGTILSLFVQALSGIRNQLFAGPLWFIPCLFVVSVLFAVLLKLLKKPWLMMAACIVISFLSETILPNKPLVKPSWFFNIDSALYYILYYAIGAFVYRRLAAFSYQKLSTVKKVLFLILCAAVIAYTAAVYFQKAGILYAALTFIPYIGEVITVITALTVIFFNMLLAYPLSALPLLSRIGQNTLFLCGNEFIIKTLIPVILGLAGLSLTLATPLSVFLYSFFLLVLCYYTLIPFEQKLFSKILQKKKPGN